MTTLSTVRDLAHLIELSSGADPLECFIALAGGARSSKRIVYLEPTGRFRHTGRFDVCNEIDDSWQVLWPSQLWTRSNIGAALDAGALIAEL